MSWFLLLWSAAAHVPPGYLADSTFAPACRAVGAARQLGSGSSSRGRLPQESNLQQDRWVTGEVDSLVRAARAAYENDEARPAYNRVLDGISRAMRVRGFAADPGFASRYPEFVEYIKALSIDRRPDHEMGFVIPDKQYFDETAQYVQIPDFLLKPDFLRWVSRSESLDRAKAYLSELNSQRKADEQLIFFSYVSRHLGTPDNDNSFKRLLIVVPGNPAQEIPEKWVQFGVTDPRGRPRVRNVSVVSAVPAADGTFNSYFKDYFRTYRRDGTITITGRWELGYGDDNCARCHKTGILPIFPDKDSVVPGEQPAVEAVNERFRTYGSPRFDKYLDETTFGPGLSSASSVSRERRFGAGFSKTAAGEAMSCSGCHQPAGLGALNWPMDSVLITSYVEGGQMPFGSSLSEAERTELYNKLIQEYFSTNAANPGILKSWLLGSLK